MARLADDVARDDVDRDVVGRRIERDGGAGEVVDLGGGHLGGAGFCRRDRDDAGARAEVEHTLARNDFRVVENVPSERLAARPGEGPIGRRQAARLQLGFGHLPQRQNLAGEVKRNLRHKRCVKALSVRFDERLWIAHSAPAASAMKMNAPALRLARKI